MKLTVRQTTAANIVVLYAHAQLWQSERQTVENINLRTIIKIESYFSRLEQLDNFVRKLLQLLGRCGFVW